MTHMCRSLYRPPSPDYIPGLEEPQSPPPPDFVPEIVYPEFMPQKDEVFSAEEQPLPAAASPTAQSPDYVLEFDPEADPEEDDDEDPEEDPADYPADGGDDGDDEDEPSDDDKDEEVDIEADDEEEEEHPTPADSTAVALPAINQALSVEETEPFETNESATTPPPHPAYRVIARISIPAPVPTPIPSPPLPLILSPLIVSPPLPQISSPPLPISLPVPVLSPSPPASHIRPLGYQAAMIRLRAEVASTSYSLPYTTTQHTLPHQEQMHHHQGIQPLHLLSIDRRADSSSLGQSMDASDLARAEVMSLHTTVLAQQSKIRELQSVDRRRQTVITEMLAADHKRQVQLTKALKLVKRLQTQMAELQRQQGPAKGPAQPELTMRLVAVLDSVLR
ncbi:hypothetical protein Tco_1210471 [Tanacetum coccineum]